MADLLYEGVRGIVQGQTSVALANGASIISLERQLGFFWEPHLQALVLPHRELLEAANWVYLNAQFTINLLFLGIIYCYRNEIFYFVRNMFFVAMGIALCVHLLVPVAPPRLYPQSGFVDSIHQIAHINQDSGAIGVFVNPYAAVPSMHICFALLVGVSAFRIARGPLLRIFALLYPLLVLAVVIITANHFIFDVAAGALTAVLAAVAAQRVMARVRPKAWSWGQSAGVARRTPAATPATESTI
ncbi:MAG: phosphatase PAP2 family protein [Solirubrobacteraceae bacterium]